jgi:major vault protein
MNECERNKCTHLAHIIRSSIFGLDKEGKMRQHLLFPANNLCVTNVDIQSAEPVDAQTRESLQKSVQLAIEITTKSQEAKAKAIAMKEDEEAKGLLLTQQLENQTQAERARKVFVELSAQCAAVEAEGAAVAHAKAKAQAAEIDAQAAVKQAELRAKALEIEHDSHMRRKQHEYELEMKHAKQMADLEIAKKREVDQLFRGDSQAESIYSPLVYICMYTVIKTPFVATLDRVGEIQEHD